MGTGSQPVIFIIDDDESMRKALYYLLLSMGFSVETYSSAEEFLTRERYEGVGCIILDVSMPGLSGMDLQEKLLESGWGTPIIFLTGHGEVPMSVRAMKKGAVDFLSKPCDDEQLLEAVDTAIKESREARARVEEVEEMRSRLRFLTPREYEILHHVVSGMLNKQIAGKLGISEATVKIHRGRIMEKLNVKSVAALVRFAVAANVEPPDSEP